MKTDNFCKENRPEAKKKLRLPDQLELGHHHNGDILGHFVKLGKAHIERMLYRVSLLDFNDGSEAGFVPSPVDGKPFYLKIFASAYLEISVAVKDEHRALGVDENILERI